MGSVQTSSPPSELSWFINDEPAHEIYVSRIYQPKPYDVNGKKDSVQSLELSFPVTTTHFHNNKVRLKCLATIAGLYWKTADVTLTQEYPKLLHTKDGPPSNSPISSRSSEMVSDYFLIFKILLIGTFTIIHILNRL